MTCSVVVIWDGEGPWLLEGGGIFNKSCGQTGREVPFYVAVEEPYAWREGADVSFTSLAREDKRETYQDCPPGSG